ncbi:MAG: hypothetical protein NTZ95_05995, partial [Candidatus Omnitrophica bacterium]|nr:hypothetical protein [Candidatus Omnitrophota bacterium]
MRFYTLYAIRYTLILAVLLIIPIGYTCAWDSTDNADRLSNGSSNVFSPGYLNAAKQHAYEVVNQINQPKSWWDNLVEAVKNKMSSEVEEQANTKVTPELKMKKSSGIGEHKKSVSITYETIVAEESNKIISEISYETINSLHYNVDIASGQNRHAETAANGQRYTVIEVGGVRHILAGFNGPDSQSSAVLQGAISIAGQNDIVLVRKGVYSGDDITITGDFSVPGI